MTIFDIGIILLFIMFIVSGAKRGVIKESVSLLAIIIVFILSFSLKGIIGNALCSFLPFFEFSGPFRGMVTLNILLYQMIAFAILFSIFISIYEVSVKISKFLQKIVNLTIIFWLPSKILGGVVSFIKGYLVLFVVLLIFMIPLGRYPIYRDSNMVQFVLYKTPVLSGATQDFVKPVKETIELCSKVAEKDISLNDANLGALDIMLRYKVVSKKTVEDLVELNKLDSVSGIEDILERY